jgi:hypothetical protein
VPHCEAKLDCDVVQLEALATAMSAPPSGKKYQASVVLAPGVTTAYGPHSASSRLLPALVPQSSEDICERDVKPASSEATLQGGTSDGPVLSALELEHAGVRARASARPRERGKDEDEGMSAEGSRARSGVEVVRSRPVGAGRARAIALLLLAAVACARHDDPPRQVASAVPLEAATPDATPEATTPALASDPPIAALAVEGFGDAVISVPTGATAPRPIVVATHGIWDFPEALCEHWRGMIGTRAWVLCVRGDPMPDKTFMYRSGPKLLREIDAGVAALKARFAGYVDDAAMLYTGFSLGAILGAWVITQAPARFPYAILTEGGEDKLTAQGAAAFVKGGGKRVLFGCGLRGRVGAASAAAAMLTRAGAGSKVVLGKLPDGGQYAHWYGGPVGDEEKAQLGWLLEGDARWGEAP